ncbi:MAG: glycosyltransferase [Candidatus Portnoybacteria bacterium]|nr:glycosyltransferase [Candidatus Portnoybacteria bacterium]
MKERIKKIGIDARFFGPEDKGFGRYAEKLIRGLEEVDKKNKYFIFLRKEAWERYVPKNKNFKKVLANYKWYGLKEQVFYPFKIRKYKLDLMHFTHFNVPLLFFGNFIVTIHDLTLRFFSAKRKNLLSSLTYPFKKIAYLTVFYFAIKKSKRIIAISGYTKKDILKHYKIRPEKIKVIYEGVDKRKEESVVRKNQILYIGNAYPHKNLERLIFAFEKLKEDFNVNLVLAGGDDYFYKKLKKKIFNSKNIVFKGFVDEKELDLLYKESLLFIFPSLYEGFGLPPLEAMSRGLVVVSSSASCLPEILGDSALFFDPFDVDDMKAKIKKALVDKGLQENLRSKGIKRVQNFNWEKMVFETLDLYGLF